MVNVSMQCVVNEEKTIKNDYKYDGKCSVFATGWDDSLYMHRSFIIFSILHPVVNLHHVLHVYIDASIRFNTAATITPCLPPTITTTTLDLDHRMVYLIRLPGMRWVHQWLSDQITKTDHKFLSFCTQNRRTLVGCDRTKQRIARDRTNKSFAVLSRTLSLAKS